MSGKRKAAVPARGRPSAGTVNQHAPRFEDRRTKRRRTRGDRDRAAIREE